MPDIKLRDGSGVENTYQGVDTITLPLADGSGNWTFGLTDEDLAYDTYDKQDKYIINGLLANIFNKYNLWNRVSLKAVKYNSVNDKVIYAAFPSTMNYVTDLSELVIDGQGANNGVYIEFNGADNLAKLPTVINVDGIKVYWCFGNRYEALSAEELYNFIYQFRNSIYTSRTAPNSNTGNIFGFYMDYSVDADSIDDILQIAHNIYNASGSEYSSSSSMSNKIDFVRNLSEVNCFPFVYQSNTPITSNVWVTYSYKTFLKEFKFCTNNGVPYEVKWKNQTFDFAHNSYSIGYSTNSATSNISHQTRYDYHNHNIFYKDKELTTLEEVQARYNELKNGRWYAQSSRQITYEGASRYMSLLFSRYNHDSAVNTINSLPDTSAYLATAGGTNTIKFRNYQGALTDGGGINDLTPAEIQVATDKGWTVTIVN